MLIHRERFEKPSGDILCSDLSKRAFHIENILIWIIEKLQKRSNLIGEVALESLVFQKLIGKHEWNWESAHLLLALLKKGIGEIVEDIEGGCRFEI